MRRRRHRTCFGTRVRLRYRSLLVAGALSCLPGCGVSPNSPGPVHPILTGEWSGTFESSWGLLPVRASLTTDRASPTIHGEFRIDGQRASGTVSGTLQTYQQYREATFWGTLTISYPTGSGAVCRSESPFGVTSGLVLETAVFFSTEGFPSGNCADPPTKVNITLRR
jgi:hypothetical protein